MVILIRSVAELTDVPTPAWPAVREVFADARAPVEVLPVSPDAGASALYRLQVTTRSVLGALAFHTGGVLVDHGWVRVLGGGHPGRGLPGLPDAAGFPDDPAQVNGPPPALLVGYDVLGGRFEINGHDPAATGRPGDPGQLCYFAPDTLEWEPLTVGGHAAWLEWLVSGHLGRFYEGLRWNGWEDDVAALPLDHGIAVYPFLFTEEGSDIDATTRRPAPIAELFSWQNEMAARFAR
ncbi:DUF2625 family protein [Thermomonospora cellulosilytica]|uniref:DUF2625 domain-containing protein n=1 Tax=Thermomonospora cellulosilytica TaxID=1411118 RepID=A0A7W3MUU5_9ACTN|nr:DUF2625 family protein [Thermomonospora cellulosilytica]MBA9002305.1 hypothetical protein [Thermomonospora cellulosilytica]